LVGNAAGEATNSPRRLTTLIAEDRMAAGTISNSFTTRHIFCSLVYTARVIGCRTGTEAVVVNC